MRCLLAVVVVAACGGPSRSQLAETPSAQTRARPAVAPAASTSDRDREGLTQQFEDMETTQRAHREAKGAPTPVPAAGSGSAAPVKKKGPAEQAPPQK